jgi:hypothetical protein
MPDKLKSPTFWRRSTPKPLYDIVLLRPADLPKGERFETAKDARKESIRSASVLAACEYDLNSLAKELKDCRTGDNRCDNAFCPICARDFRRWLTGELLRVTEPHQSITILTVLLAEADRGNLGDLAPADWQHRLRKRLQRTGLKNTPVIGGFEVIYRAKEKKWVLHINLVIIGGNPKAVEAFKATFDRSGLDRPVFEVPLTDRIKQLSYILKFTTYHRPFQQDGPTKSPARPLNAAEHYALVSWMAEFQFKDFLFLFNARRQGSLIRLKHPADR